MLGGVPAVPRTPPFGYWCGGAGGGIFSVGVCGMYRRKRLACPRTKASPQELGKRSVVRFDPGDSITTRPH
jgi:hypothetical protein